MEQQGLDADDARRFLELARVAFELFTEPVDRDWHFRLQKISAVAADIGEVPSTHINHLTPRVLDIDVLYERMEARGITMIQRSSLSDWEGPDVLLRQTSFKALAEERQFRHADGTVRPGSLRIRFGEVEQRGVALTAAGRDRCDWMVTETDARLAAAPEVEAGVLVPEPRSSTRISRRGPPRASSSRTRPRRAPPATRSWVRRTTSTYCLRSSADRSPTGPTSTPRSSRRRWTPPPGLRTAHHQRRLN